MCRKIGSSQSSLAQKGRVYNGYYYFQSNLISRHSTQSDPLIVLGLVFVPRIDSHLIKKYTNNCQIVNQDKSLLSSKSPRHNFT